MPAVIESALEHACGHDAHVACALGAAMLLARESHRGTVRFLFQPSEEQRDDEGHSGAVKMIEEGALNNVRAVALRQSRSGNFLVQSLATQVIGAIQQIVSRRIAPVLPAVVSITTIHGGLHDRAGTRFDVLAGSNK